MTGPGTGRRRWGGDTAARTGAHRTRRARERRRDRTAWPDVANDGARPRVDGVRRPGRPPRYRVVRSGNEAPGAAMPLVRTPRAAAAGREVPGRARAAVYAPRPVHAVREEHSVRPPARRSYGRLGAARHPARYGDGRGRVRGGGRIAAPGPGRFRPDSGTGAR
ncbi:hypothetical protein NKH77_54265 [Streptomyces sp. M19]